MKKYLESVISSTVQLASMCVSLGMFYCSPALSIMLTAFLLVTPLCPLLLGYFFWIYLDRNTPHGKGRRIEWLRSLGVFHYFRGYFPQLVVRTADLPPTRNYILCIFPHGILCTSAIAQLTSTNSDFFKLFPGIDVACHTLTNNFYVPFSREYILAIGFRTVSKEALKYHLENGSGHASALVIGGSAEAMLSTPGSHRVVLKDRKGFVKLALTTGACLVPVYQFGETELYQQCIFPKTSLIYRCQEAVRKWTGVAPVLALGRGIIGRLPGPLPFAKPVTMLVGAPIPVEKKERPTKEDINQLHQTFINALTALFEKHKHLYVSNPESTFLSIE